MPAARDGRPDVCSPALVSVPVPSGVAPSWKVTVPLGVPAPGAVTVTLAVKVTACPTTDGLAEELSTVVVSALFRSEERRVGEVSSSGGSPAQSAGIAWV